MIPASYLDSKEKLSYFKLYLQLQHIRHLRRGVLAIYEETICLLALAELVCISYSKHLRH